MLLCLVYRNSRPTLTTVARYEESEVFIEKENDEKENSLCYVKFDGPLNFVSAGNFTLTGARLGFKTSSSGLIVVHTISSIFFHSGSQMKIRNEFFSYPQMFFSRIEE